MTELSIRPEEIRDALDSFVQSYEPGAASREEVGRVIDAGDGIAHVEGLPSAMTNELLQFADGTLGIALNLDVARDRRRRPRRLLAASRRARRSSGPARSSPSPSATTSSAASINPLGEPIDGLGDDRGRDPSRARAAGAHRGAAQVGARAAADRPQGRRRDDADRPRPAPAHHRRPPDRQDHGRGRHDHQPEGATGSPATPSSRCAASTSRIGQKGSTIAAVRGTLEEAGAMEYTTIVAAPASDAAGLQVPRALHRLGHRPALDVPGQARPHRLRRPVQAGRGLPRRVAAAAPPAGPRGLPRRRLLPAQPAARALRQALRRARRRLDDRSADHRDQGR